MANRADIQKWLIDADDSVLIVIDIQDSFLKKYEHKVSKPMVARAAWLVGVARALQVPIVAMAEDIDNAGTLTQAILEVLPINAPVHIKECFNLAGQPETTRLD